jgi:hypothetical protein
MGLTLYSSVRSLSAPKFFLTVPQQATVEYASYRHRIFPAVKETVVAVPRLNDPIWEAFRRVETCPDSRHWLRFFTLTRPAIGFVLASQSPEIKQADGLAIGFDWDLRKGRISCWVRFGKRAGQGRWVRFGKPRPGEMDLQKMFSPRSLRRSCCGAACLNVARPATSPHPNPPPQGGRESERA